MIKQDNMDQMEYQLNNTCKQHNSTGTPITRANANQLLFSRRVCCLFIQMLLFCDFVF